MALADKLIKDFEELSDEKKREVIDFIEFLKTKEKKSKADLMDSIIDENEEALKELAK